MTAELAPGTRVRLTEAAGLYGPGAGVVDLVNPANGYVSVRGTGPWHGRSWVLPAAWLEVLPRGGGRRARG